MILKNTYLLTATGWYTVQDLTIGKKITGIHDDNLVLSTITDINQHQYSGVVYKTKKSQILPDTKLLTKTNRLKKIKNIKNKNTILSPKYDYSGYKLNPITYKGMMLDTCLILTIIGYFVECGKLQNKNTIVFKNSKIKLNTVSNTFNLLNIKNTISISKKGMLLHIYNKQLYSFLLQFYFDRSQLHTNKHKYIPRRFLNLDKLYLRYLLSAILNSSDFGETFITKEFTIQTNANSCITTPSQLLTDNIHELAIKLGFPFSTFVIHRDPMRKEMFNPLNYNQKIGSFETKIIRSDRFDAITKNKINTTVYSLTTTPKLKFVLIRNNSASLWIGDQIFIARS
jgi:hypothetical protein